MLDFTDRAILVTGSTRGIGRAVAALLADHGATVGVHGRDPDRVREACAALDERTGRACTIAVPGDLDTPDTAPGLVRGFAGAAGRLDGLVNNAGGGQALAFRAVDLDRWRATFRVNLEAAVLAAREAYVLMRRARTGVIVNVTSLAAHGPGRWMGADYAASKAGLVSLTKSLALEAGRLGIRVNAVSPGIVETEMTAVMTDTMKERLGVPLGRLGRADEVAGAVGFLLSDASSYITGHVLHVNGGLHM